MPTILLVRHGQGSFGTADYDVLSERGGMQAAAVHAALRERGVTADRLVSGSLRRQRDTALPWTSAGEAWTSTPLERVRLRRHPRGALERPGVAGAPRR